MSYGGSGTVFARTSVFTCLVELGVAVLCLLPINVARGETHRFTTDRMDDNIDIGNVGDTMEAAAAAPVQGASSGRQPPDITTNKATESPLSFNHSTF